MALFVELAGVNAAAVGGDVWGSLVFGCAVILCDGDFRLPAIDANNDVLLSCL